MRKRSTTRDQATTNYSGNIMFKQASLDNIVEMYASEVIAFCTHVTLTFDL